MSAAEIQNIISHYTRDSDPRVRKSALNSLVRMHLRGCPLDLGIYNLSVIALRDDYEEVRMGGLNLMGVLSALYPEHRMRLAHEEINETTRLIDDAFNRVCDLVNDSAVTIRTKACVMMASYQHVGTDTLAQTFSKKIMSNFKRTVPKYKLQQKKYARLAKQGGYIPVAEGDIDVESDEFHLLDSGACGAFIHGLEDEFMEVRNASIDSICELCMYNENLTKKAAEFLVDMFNDDIEKIRLNAIQSLRKIGSRTVLEFDEEQLEIAVGAFEDSDPIARQSAHELLTVIRLTEQESLVTLLTAMEANIKRYPTDILSIYRCLCEVGKRHEDYVEHLIPTLLNLDKRYLPKEANVEDIMYTAYVILIANACLSNIKLLQGLPKYIFRHFAYFKSKYPECLPDLRKLYKIAGIKLEGDVDCLPMTFSASTRKLIAADADNYMTTTIDTLRAIKSQLEKNELSTALLTIEVAMRNFKYISRLKPILLGKSELAQLYLECYELVIKVKQSHSSPTYADTAQSIAASLLKKSYIIQYTFLGLSKQTLRAAMYYRIMANMIWIQFIETADDTQPTITLAELKKNLSTASELPLTAKITHLYKFMMHTTAEITLPKPNVDKPFKFKSEYPVAMRVEADIFNAYDTNTIAVEIILPDQLSIIFWPSPSHFKPVKPYCYKLSTDVQLSLEPWTVPKEMIIRIVQSFEPDLPELDEYIMKYPDYATVKTSSNMEPSTIPTSSCVISEHLNYSLWPMSMSSAPNSNINFIRPPL
ncbi:armadillo-type protein [Mycotypha africana]|uniref:armadillo-type protein n=1 Tax=Mycotypha africana TaxID=64632 RepID=UPI002301F891|nr:armadillo-type protein [Mycotypha africana]KAI8968585.1 armadillo-type protein [Mycotypha africana]